MDVDLAAGLGKFGILCLSRFAQRSGLGNIELGVQAARVTTLFTYLRGVKIPDIPILARNDNATSMLGTNH